METSRVKTDFEDLKKTIINILRVNSGVYEKSKIWNLTRPYYGSTPAAEHFGVGKMNELFKHLTDIIHFDPTGTMVMLGPEPRSQRGSQETRSRHASQESRPGRDLQEGSGKAMPGHAEMEDVKKKCIIILKQNRGRVRKGEMWTLYGKKFRESPSPHRMGLTKLEDLLTTSSEFAIDGDFVVLKKPRSTPSAATDLEQVKEQCVKLLEENGGKLQKSNFWNKFSQRYRTSQSASSLGLKHLEDVFSMFRYRFAVQSDTVYLVRGESPGKSSNQAANSKVPLKPLWGAGTQTASSLSGSSMSLASSNSDSDDIILIGSEPPLNPNSQASSLQPLWSESGIGRRTDHPGFLSLEVASSSFAGQPMIFSNQQQLEQIQQLRQQFERQQQQLLQLQQMRQQHMTGQPLGPQPLMSAMQQLEQIQQQQQQFEGQQQQLLQLQQQMRQQQMRQQHMTGQPLDPQPLMSTMPRPMMLGNTVVPQGRGEDSAVAYHQSQPVRPVTNARTEPPAPIMRPEPVPTATGGGQFLPPPLPPQEPMWPSQTERKWIPQERKGVEVKPFSFTHGQLAKDQYPGSEVSGLPAWATARPPHSQTSSSRAPVFDDSLSSPWQMVSSDAEEALSLYPEDSASALYSRNYRSSAASPTSNLRSPLWAASLAYDDRPGAHSSSRSPARPSAHSTLAAETSSYLDEAARLISSILPPDVCPPSPPLKRKASALVDAPHQAKRFKSLPQPPAFRDLTDAFNAHLQQGKLRDNRFFSDSLWLEDVDRFRQHWYAGHSQSFFCPLPSLDIKAEVQAGGKVAARQLIPLGLDITATLIRNALACAGFLELATQAVVQCAEEDSERPIASRLCDIHTLAVMANRAAYHVSTNALAAAANCDLMRRDAILRSCSDMPAAVKSQLRKAPIGGSLLFGPTWDAVKESAKDLWPSAPGADPAQFQASRKAVRSARWKLGLTSQPAAMGAPKSSRQPLPGCLHAVPVPSPSWPKSAQRSGHRSAQ